MRYLWTEYRADRKIYSAPTDFLVEEASDDGEDLVINPRLRFAEIFDPLLTLRRDTDEIQNVLYHVLARLDVLSGLTRDFLVEELLREELERDAYGKEAGELFRGLSKKAGRIILAGLRRQEESGGRHSAYVAALRALFPGVRLYFYHEEERFLAVFPCRETDARKKLLRLCEILFLDITAAEPRYFWREHFGVVGLDETMHADRLVIY